MSQIISSCITKHAKFADSSFKQKLKYLEKGDVSSTLSKAGLWIEVDLSAPKHVRL